MRAEPNRIAAVAGMLAVFFNVLGVVFVSEIAEAYQPELIDRWYFAALQHEFSVSWSAWCFTLAVLCLVPWVAGMARSIGPYSWPGAAMIAMGAGLNATASLLPFVVVTHVPHGEDALGETLLGITITIDALFYLIFGVGLVLLNVGMARAVQFPMWLSGWGLVAGILCVGVVGRAWSPAAANFVYVAAPFWMLWVALASGVLFRLPAFEERLVPTQNRRSTDVFLPSSGVADPYLPQSAK